MFTRNVFIGAITLLIWWMGQADAAILTKHVKDKPSNVISIKQASNLKQAFKCRKSAPGNAGNYKAVKGSKPFWVAEVASGMEDDAIDTAFKAGEKLFVCKSYALSGGKMRGVDEEDSESVE